MVLISIVILPDFAYLWRDQNKSKFKIRYQIFSDTPENGYEIPVMTIFIFWKHNAPDQFYNFWLHL